MGFIFENLECEFLEKELDLNFSPNVEYTFTKDEIFDMRDKTWDIEAQEIPDNDDEEYSLRGMIAVNIVNRLGGHVLGYPEIYNRFDSYETESDETLVAAAI